MKKLLSPLGWCSTAWYSDARKLLGKSALRNFSGFVGILTVIRTCFAPIPMINLDAMNGSPFNIFIDLFRKAYNMELERTLLSFDPKRSKYFKIVFLITVRLYLTACVLTNFSQPNFDLIYFDKLFLDFMEGLML